MRKEKFTCQCDAEMIRGTVFLPDLLPPQGAPIAVICHEFMANRFFSYPYARELAENGYAAFCFDFRGGGLISASQGSSRDMSVVTEMADLKAVIRFAQGRDYTDGNTLILMGCSQGGLVAAIAAAELRAAVEGLILQYPALCIPDDARSGHMMMARFDPENIPENLRCGPMRLGRRYVTDVIGMDVFSEISGYTGRVLLLHGDRDALVDIAYSQRACQVYQVAGADASLQVIDGAGHIFVHRRHIRAARNRIREFVTWVDTDRMSTGMWNR